MIDRVEFALLVLILLFIAREASFANRSLKEIEGKLDAILKKK
jgi:hypothetical protein